MGSSKGLRTIDHIQYYLQSPAHNLCALIVIPDQTAPQNSSLFFPEPLPHPLAGFMLGTGSSCDLLAVSDNSGGR